MATEVERNEVELPLIAQLKAMGWTHVPGSQLDRDSTRDVLLTDRIASALRRINLVDGKPWLDDDRIRDAIRQLSTSATGGLLEANTAATKQLLEGVKVAGHPVHHRGGWTTVTLIEFDPELVDRNEFVVSDQVRVTTAGGDYAVLDVVLFVNGIPLVVIECKSPDTHDAIGFAVRDLRAYAGDPLPDEYGDTATSGAGMVAVPRLFHTAQLLVATCGEHAALGTITGAEQHFLPWRSVEPENEPGIRAELRAVGLETPATLSAPLTEQQMLAGVALRPARLLDIVRHFVILKPADDAEPDGRQVKVVCRHQQYRAVAKTLHRLRTGRTRAQAATPGDIDRRGGVVFHTQGSGKSLTMGFLIRAMRSDPRLHRFMVVVVTDRTDLQRQLSRTLEYVGDDVVVADTRADVEALLTRGQSRVVFAMIQKYRADRPVLRFAGDGAAPDPDVSDLDDPDDPLQPSGSDTPGSPQDSAGEVTFPLCNDSEDILVIVDEAHRSHTSVLHACLSQAVPNAARVGFTGTPIVSANKTNTTRIFGDFLDEYRLRESEADGATVPILYEGRTGPGRVVGRYALDKDFDELLRSRPVSGAAPAAASVWPSQRDVIESEPIIRAKAADMLRHYVSTALVGGFKAQVAVGSRRAAILYRAALAEARDDLLADIAAFDAARLERSPDEELSETDRFLRQASRFAPLLRRIEFVPVISPDRDKNRRWIAWTDEDARKDHIARFLQPLPQPPPGSPWTGHAGSGSRRPTSPSATASARGPWSERAAAADEPTDPAPEAASDAIDPTAPIAFLIVKSMLLTGFDAPREQVLYLDRTIQEAELLQAVARVNRPANGKQAGYVVDYAGVLDNLRAALAAYDPGDENAMSALRDFASEEELLRAAHDDLRRFLAVHGITAFETPDDLLSAARALSEPHDRVEFDDLMSEFSEHMENVLPRPEALAFAADAKRFALLQKRVRRLARDGRAGGFQLRGYGRRLRALIAEHLELPEIDQAIPQISLTALGYDDRVAAIADPRNAAAEMASALRFHLEDHVRLRDPVLYASLSQRLEEILRDLDGRWQEQRDLLPSLLAESRIEADPGLPGLTALEQSVFRLVEQAVAGDTPQPPVEPGDELFEPLRSLTIELCDDIGAHVRSAAYQGSEADRHELAQDLAFTARQLWSAVHGSDEETAAALERLGERLASYAEDNRRRFHDRVTTDR